MGDIEIGSWDKLPHYSINGKGPQDFYVWINEDGMGKASGWITTEFNAWHLLKKLKNKNKKQFISKIKELFYKYKPRD